MYEALSLRSEPSRPQVMVASHPDWPGDLFELRSKLMTFPDDILLHQRAKIRNGEGFFHIHTVISTTALPGAMISFQSGSTDNDAWARVRGDLMRRGYDIDQTTTS